MNERESKTELGGEENDGGRVCVTAGQHRYELLVFYSVQLYSKCAPVQRNDDVIKLVVCSHYAQTVCNQYRALHLYSLDMYEEHVTSSFLSAMY